jgi:hypothetical protein
MAVMSVVEKAAAKVVVRVDKRVAQTVEMSDVSMALTMVVMSAVVMVVS